MRKERVQRKILNTTILIVCVLITLCASLFCAFSYFYPKKYSMYINLMSEKYDVDKALIYSIINTESKFSPNATSEKGAMGLMQIIPSTATFIAQELDVENFKVDDMYVPKTNIEFGVYYLKYLYSKFDSADAVICSYNAGETVVRRWLNDKTYSADGKTFVKIPYKETANYLKKVKQNYKVYKKIV